MIFESDSRCKGQNTQRFDLVKLARLATVFFYPHLLCGLVLSKRWCGATEACACAPPHDDLLGRMWQQRWSVQEDDSFPLLLEKCQILVQPPPPTLFFSFL